MPAATLEVDLGREVTIGRAFLSEAYDRVQAFELQRRVGEEWQAFAQGTTIGEDLVFKFAPVTARFVRLNLLQATEGPTIWEFQLLAP